MRVALPMAIVTALLCRVAAAETVVFPAQLLASNEVAPVVVHPTEAGASGDALVTLDVVRDGMGNITSATARFDVLVTGLASTSVIILAHVHEGAAGVNGPIRIDSGISPANPVPVVAGAATFSRSGLAVSPSVAASLLQNPAGFYFNVHTALSPGGALRGQLGVPLTPTSTPTSTPTDTPTPTPTSTPTSTPTDTPTPTPTATPTTTPTPSPTSTATPTPTATATPANTSTPAATAIPGPPPGAIPTLDTRGLALLALLLAAIGFLAARHMGNQS